MKNLSTNITINATPDEVWYTFSKFHAFELWNPFIGNINGDIKEGAKLKVTDFKEDNYLRWEKRSLFLGSYIHEFRFPNK